MQHLTQQQKDSLFENLYVSLSSKGFDAPFIGSGIAVFSDMSISDVPIKENGERCIFWLDAATIHNMRAIFTKKTTKENTFRATATYRDWANLIVSMVDARYEENTTTNKTLPAFSHHEKLRRYSCRKIVIDELDVSEIINRVLAEEDEKDSTLIRKIKKSKTKIAA